MISKGYFIAPIFLLAASSVWADQTDFSPFSDLEWESTFEDVVRVVCNHPDFQTVEKYTIGRHIDVVKSGDMEEFCSLIDDYQSFGFHLPDPRNNVGFSIPQGARKVEGKAFLVSISQPVELSPVYLNDVEYTVSISFERSYEMMAYWYYEEGLSRAVCESELCIFPSVVGGVSLDPIDYREYITRRDGIVKVFEDTYAGTPGYLKNPDNYQIYGIGGSRLSFKTYNGEIEYKSDTQFGRDQLQGGYHYVKYQNYLDRLDEPDPVGADSSSGL